MVSYCMNCFRSKKIDFKIATSTCHLQFLFFVEFVI